MTAPINKEYVNSINQLIEKEFQYQPNLASVVKQTFKHILTNTKDFNDVSELNKDFPIEHTTEAFMYLSNPKLKILKINPCVIINDELVPVVITKDVEFKHPITMEICEESDVIVIFNEGKNYEKCFENISQKES